MAVWSEEAGGSSMPTQDIKPWNAQMHKETFLSRQDFKSLDLKAEGNISFFSVEKTFSNNLTFKQRSLQKKLISTLPPLAPIWKISTFTLNKAATV